jgi:hypothetical protein
MDDFAVCEKEKETPRYNLPLMGGGNSMNKWLKRFTAVMWDLTALRTLTKNVPASTWTPEYRELAEKIHGMGRDHFNTGIIVEMNEEKKLSEGGETPIEAAYRALCEMQARFPHCPFCGRKFPGHCQDTCIIVRTYAAVREEQE